MQLEFVIRGPSPVDQDEPRVSLTQSSCKLMQAHAAQGGVTLGPEQGEPGANFCHLGTNFFGVIHTNQPVPEQFFKNPM